MKIFYENKDAHVSAIQHSRVGADIDISWQIAAYLEESFMFSPKSTLSWLTLDLVACSLRQIIWGGEHFTTHRGILRHPEGGSNPICLGVPVQSGRAGHFGVAPVAAS